MNTLTGTVSCYGCAYMRFDKDKYPIGDYECLQQCHRDSMGDNIICNKYKSIVNKWAEDFIANFKTGG